MKKIYIAFLGIGIVFSILVLDNTSAYSKPEGSPQSVTGSPADGASCAKSGCHSGTASAQDGLITSNIPTSGYMPGSTYTITVSISQTGISKWGFSISPQSVGGSVLGSIIVTNTTQTQLINNRYVTHKTAGNSGTNSKTWSFDWIAPAAGTGDVPFYASVMASNSSGNAIGDQVYNDVYTVSEDLTSSITASAAPVEFSVYPNPVDGNQVTISFGANTNKPATLRLMNLRGELVREERFESVTSGQQNRVISMNELPTGIYLLQLVTEEGTIVRRIIRH